MEKVVNLNSTEFKNYLKHLKSASSEISTTFALKAEHPTITVKEVKGKIIELDPMGGPKIKVGESLDSVGEVTYIDYIVGYGYVISFKK